jgi:hypothetical protein
MGSLGGYFEDDSGAVSTQRSGDNGSDNGSLAEETITETRLPRRDGV